MIEIKNKVDCCGCNACGDACAKKAITFKIDNEGYWSDLLTRYSSGVSSNTSKRIPEVRKRPRGMAVSVEDLKKAIKRIK